MSLGIAIRHIYISPGHNYFGHHCKPAGNHPVFEVQRAHCLAGRGLEGDRFCAFRENYKGQITFFAWEVYEILCRECGVQGIPPSAFRRNVITQGVDLASLIGKEFELQGIHFAGTDTCAPCYWMNSAFHPEAEHRLQGRGGLRARILSDGWLETTA